jgi:hypothetical protein
MKKSQQQDHEKKRAQEWERLDGICENETEEKYEEQKKKECK